MVIGGNSYSYFKEEESFLDYFKQMRNLGMSMEQLESILPDMEKYYKPLVLDKLEAKGISIYEVTLVNLFNKWKNSYL